MTLFGSDPDQTVSEDERNFFKERGTNIGLYIVGTSCVSPEGLSFDNQPRTMDEKDIAPNKERVKILKDQGTLVINQIHHGGCMALKRLTGIPVMTVSADVVNKELEKKGQLNDETKAVEFSGEEAKRINLFNKI